MFTDPTADLRSLFPIPPAAELIPPPLFSTEHWLRPQDDLGGGNNHPFKCPNTGGDGSVVVGGTVNGVAATGLTLDIGTSGTVHVYIQATYTSNITANGYRDGFSAAITAALGTNTSVPSDTTSDAYRLVATYVDGVKTLQAVTSSMEVLVYGTTSTPTIVWGQA